MQQSQHRKNFQSSHQHQESHVPLDYIGILGKVAGSADRTYARTNIAQTTDGGAYRIDKINSQQR